MKAALHINYGWVRIMSQTANHIQEINDDLLAERIRDALKRQNIRTLRQIVVEVRDQNALVTGHVNSFYEKQLATSCCQQVAGIARIVNNLTVAGY